MKNNTGFTLVELIVVVTILIILSGISFVAYTSQLTDARNAVRISDMGNIKMSFKNHKLKNGSYPLPGNPFDITNSGIIIKQGFLNQEVYTQEMDKKPTDPFVKGQYYFYSVTQNKLFFQIAMSIEDDTLENDYDMRAYVDGDYQTLNEDFIPSIVFATSFSGSIESLSSNFILDKGTLNLPYDENGDIVKTAVDKNEILHEEGINITKFYGYSTCSEIYENGASLGSGTYIVDNNGQLSSTGCTMSY